jgi:hypothetical protein
MTTQAVSCIVGNARMSRVFSATATDSQYNNLIDSTTSTAIGLTLSGQTITYLCGTYAAGAAIGRIISSQTNVVKRQFICSDAGLVDPAECMIQPYVVAPDDLLQIYSVVVNGTANKTNVLGLITSNRGVEPFISMATTDSTLTPMTSIISGLGLGDLLFGATLLNVAISCEDGASLTNITLVNAASGTDITQQGSVRGSTGGAMNLKTNGSFNMSYPVQKGYVLNCTTITG